MHTFGGVLDVELAFAACDVGDGDSTIFFCVFELSFNCVFNLIQIWYFCNADNVNGMFDVQLIQ